MKIKTVYIVNFKNFEGEHKFELNEHMNIFYAENGFGKSSFFDALEWCLTGEINRFKEYDNFSDEDIINYNINKDEHYCSVKVDFLNGSIKRYFNVENLKKKGNTQVTVEYKDENGNMIKANGKNYINKLIKNNDCLGINSLANIKQTHILSQDQITNFINSEDSKDRYQNILSIMGIENKVIIENLKNISKKLEQRINILESNLEKLEHKEKLILAEKKDFNKSLVVDKINNLNLSESNYCYIISLLNENSDKIPLDKSIKDRLNIDIMKYKGQLLLLEKIDVDTYENIESF